MRRGFAGSMVGVAMWIVGVVLMTLFPRTLDIPLAAGEGVAIGMVIAYWAWRFRRE